MKQWYDSDGKKVYERDRIGFSYGIPSNYAKAWVIKVGNRLSAIVDAPHTPTRTTLYNLKKCVGNFYVIPKGS